MQNRTGLALCALTLLTGFLLTCLGAFLISSDSALHCQKRQVLAYFLLPLGFTVLLSGIFWSTYRQASQSKGLFRRMLRRHLAPRDLLLATVDRPDFYPPAYEESHDAEKQARTANRGALDVPPPLYTESSAEFREDNEAHPEAPPSYQESSVAAATSEDTAKPSRGLKAGHAPQLAGCAFLDLRCS